MSDTFILGKPVIVYFTDDSILSGKLVKMPQGAGDTVHIKSGDNLVAINMNASTVERMEQTNA